MNSTIKDFKSEVKSDSKIKRMLDLQIMNLINIGFDKGIDHDDILIAGNAIINASQLFISNKEEDQLRTSLVKRMHEKRYRFHF